MEENYVPIKNVASKDFREAIEIYTNSFPANERQTIENIKFKIEKRPYFMYGYKRDGTILAFSLLYLFKENNFGLVDYMAVKKGYRNMGIGTNLFNYTCERAFTELNSTESIIFLEVEDPACSSNENEGNIRKRRINLYARLGAKIVDDLQYILPPLSKEFPTMMLLMTVTDKSKKQLRTQELMSSIKKIYSDVYNRGKNDEYLDRMINEILNKDKKKI